MRVPLGREGVEDQLPWRLDPGADVAEDLRYRHPCALAHAPRCGLPVCFTSTPPVSHPAMDQPDS